MKAENRLLGEWFNQIRTGRIRLPRFQRYEVWGHAQISSLLETLFRGLPAGATLVLEVGTEEQFPSRPMSGAPEPNTPCREHLLDGQQRLTALWKCVHDLYDDRTYFVYFKADEDHDGRQVPWIYGQARWWKDGTRYPIWCDNPREVHSRDYIPIQLLRPEEEMPRDIRKWCDVATSNDLAASRELEDRILSLREQVSSYNIPYLALPASTPSDVALDVFIKLNTTSVKLSTFDVIVAKFEEETGQSLRQLASGLGNEVSNLARFIEPEELILGVAALRDGYAPTQANFQRLDLRRMSDEWPEIVAGVKWAVDCLEGEAIFDGARLPTVAVLPVLSALHAEETKALTNDPEARTLIRKYLWRAFLTRRYENSVSNRSLQDFRGLRYALVGHEVETDAPVFDEHQFPLPTVEELMLAGWPKNRDILARGILAISLKTGAVDVADNAPVDATQVRLRDYRHLYSFALLTSEGQMPGSETYRALNCALLTLETHQIFEAHEGRRFFKGKSEPKYFVADKIKERLQSHLVPVEHLPLYDYAEIKDPDDRAEKVRVDYQSFLRARAKLMETAIHDLCEGKDWPNAGAARLPRLKNAG